MLAGRLEIELAANVARLTADMASAKSIVGQTTREIDRLAGQMRSALSTLGVAAGGAGFGLLTKHAIDALDALGDLSKTTRVAATELAGLGFAAKQSGGQLEGAASGINKLAQNMGQNAEKFAALGVSAKDPIEALKQLADVTNALEDPQQRAAVLSEALGKSWQQLAPLLAEGSGKIGDLVQRGRELSGVTETNVRLADEFNDKMGEVATAGGGKLNQLLEKMLPILTAAADGMLQASKNTTIWQYVSDLLAEALRAIIVLGGNVGFVLQAIGAEAVGVATQLVALAHGDIKGFMAIGKEMKADAAAGRKAFDEWEASIMAVGSAAAKSKPQLDAMDQVSRRMASEASAAARAFLEDEKRRKASEDAAKKAAQEAERLRQDDIKGWVAHAEAVLAEDEKRLADMAKISEEYWRNEERLRKADEAGWIAYIDATTADYEEGLRAQAALHKSAAEVRAEIDKKALHDNVAMWNEIGDVAGDFFADLVMNGKSAFDNLKRFVKQLLGDMIALFAKRWVLNMVGGGDVWGSAVQAAGGSLMGSAAGSAAGGAAGAAAGGAGAGGGMSNAALSAFVAVVGNIPVIGWIIAAIAVIAKWLGGKGGGPKVGGSFFQGGAVPDTDNGRFFTPSEGDEQMRTLVTATSTGYQDAMRRLGADAGGFNFGLGFDHDPRGSARSRVSAMLTDTQGNVLYNVRDREMDDKEVEGALQLESQRMLLKALQSSELPTEIATLLDTLVAETATGEQITQIIKAALELKGVMDALGDLAQGRFGLTMSVADLRAFALDGETISQTFNRVGGAWTQLVDQFSTDESKFAAAQEALAGLGIQLPATREGWLDIMRSLDLSTESGRKLFERMMALAPAFDLVTSAAEGMMNDFDALMGRLRPGYTAGRQGLQLTSDVQSFMAANGWTAGMTPQQVIAQLRTITREDFALYSRSNQQLILSIVDLDETVRGNTSAIAASSAGVTGSASSQFGMPGLVWNNGRWVPAPTAPTAQGGAGSSLRGWLDSLMMGSLSPLSPEEKLTKAAAGFEKALGSGDMNLQAVAQTYIDQARAMFGSSSAFQTIFEKVFNSVAGVADAPGYNERMVELQTRQADLLADVYDVLIQIRDRGDENADYIAGAVATAPATATPERR